MTTAERYKSTSTLLFDQAMVELENGDLIQASEKLWGAAAQALKSVAERRGWNHNSHAQFYNIMARIEQEVPNSHDLRRGFDTATHLHINFYENRMSHPDIRERLDDVRSFIEQIDSLSR